MPGKDQTTAQITIPCTSTPVPPTQVREVLPCPHCGLVQFRTQNSLCRRCHIPLEAVERLSTPEDMRPAPSPDAAVLNESTLVKKLGTRVREVRRMYGLTQNALARQMDVPRTTFRKSRCSGSFQRLRPCIASQVLSASRSSICICDARIHPCELAAIAKDPFPREIALLAEKLNPQQRAVLLRAVREATLRRKSAA